MATLFGVPAVELWPIVARRESFTGWWGDRGCAVFSPGEPRLGSRVEWTPMRRESVLTEVVRLAPGRLLATRRIAGPFLRWRHVRALRPATAGSCWLEDRIRYEFARRATDERSDGERPEEADRMRSALVDLVALLHRAAAVQIEAGRGTAAHAAEFELDELPRRAAG
jgi:hypothetical protein